MEKKQTAVEWLIEQIKEQHPFWTDIFEQAKQMEKDQMIEFTKGFWYYGNGADAPPCYNEDVEKYYNKVYKK
jgi:hypothetical protein